MLYDDASSRHSVLVFPYIMITIIWRGSRWHSCLATATADVGGGRVQEGKLKAEVGYTACVQY